MKVSLPVCLNEPLTALQSCAEDLLINADIFELAARTLDPTERNCITIIGFVGILQKANYRKKKPFNPMLGETYELVTNKFRFLAEKVMHTPH